MADLGVLGKAPPIQAAETDDSRDANTVLNEDEKKFEAQKREQLIRELKQNLDERHEEHELRKLFLHLVYWFVVAFVFVTLAIVTFKKLDNSVLITLLTTTTANVIGILLIAFKWLFPCKQ